MLEIQPSKKDFTSPEPKGFEVHFIVDANGLVDMKSIQIKRDDIDTVRYLKLIKSKKELWDNWLPAQSRCKRVKARSSLKVGINEA